MKLELNGIEVVCIIGDLPEERLRTQRLVVDLALVLDDEVAHSDRLESTVDYVTLSGAIRRELVKAKCKMIEHAAYVVARLVMATPKVRRVTARITKSGSVAGMASATAEYSASAEE